MWWVQISAVPVDGRSSRYTRDSAANAELSRQDQSFGTLTWQIPDNMMCAQNGPYITVIKKVSWQWAVFPLQFVSKTLSSAIGYLTHKFWSLAGSGFDCSMPSETWIWLFIEMTLGHSTMLHCPLYLPIFISLIHSQKTVIWRIFGRSNCFVCYTTYKCHKVLQ